MKIAMALSTGLFFFALSGVFFTLQQSSLIGCIAFFVTLWTNEGLPLGVVSLLPIVLFPAFGILDTKMTAANYANPIIYLFFGGFLLAIAVEKTKLHLHVANKLLGLFPATPRGMIFSLALTSALLSSILSNTTTTLLLISIAVFLTDNIKLKMRFALAITYGASIGGILTPIGTPPNLILLGIMQEHNMQLIPFFQWIFMVAPLSLFMLTSVGFLLSYGVNAIPIETKIEKKVLEPSQKKVMYLLLGLVALLFVNAPVRPYWNGLGMSESGILLGFGLALFMPPFNILQWNEDSKKIPYAIMFLFGAGFSIAKAFAQTGLADELASYLLHMTELSPLLLLLSVAVLITFTTEITSNTALISIMLPVIYSVAEHSGINTTLFMMVATLCASYAFMLPIATPPNAIAMSSGAVGVKDMMKYGIVLNLLGIFFIVFIAEYFWKNIL
ncbi:DASS family sodium-coupled anion symporter [Sulfurimonas sediminis]|uniref:DASS family sodium-coupled anion symporter n=1 Tax=Sulfurimonas sediminis TaxID=2590020 RepID=A0A7M1B241_9BACT|nr:DASS family sodium-coupled anion symporter [Sulfurimonas sediminis]QOP43829.1 DASS family sodium-coupled anion symporter [Sulfurimonas sediminis]